MTMYEELLKLTTTEVSDKVFELMDLDKTFKLPTEHRRSGKTTWFNLRLIAEVMNGEVTSIEYTKSHMRPPVPKRVYIWHHNDSWTGANKELVAHVLISLLGKNKVTHTYNSITIKEIDDE